MRKKWIIAISVIVGVIGLLVLLSFTLFSLKTVQIDCRTSFDESVLNEEKILKDADFSYKSSVFFHSKKGYKKRIEKANPYIKVVNIETVFPSKFVVHIAQRQEVYSIFCEEENMYYICDEDLFILRKQENFVSNNENCMLVEFDGQTIKGVEIGQALDIDNKIAIYSAFFENNRLLNEQKTMIEKIKFYNQLDENINENQICVDIKMFNGQSFTIKNCKYGLLYKVNMLIQVYSQIFDHIGEKMIFSGETEPVLATYEELKNVRVVIDNYYNSKKYSQKDCYFKIYRQTEII